MESHSENHEDEKNLFCGCTEDSNRNVSGNIEASKDPAEGSAFSGIFQSKTGHPVDTPPSKTTDLINLGDLEKASTKSLLSTVNGILDESIEKNSFEFIPLRVGSVLRLVVQEIERRVSKQQDDMKKQNARCRSREDRFHSRIKALETLATGNTTENEVAKMKLEEKQKVDKQVILELREEKETCGLVSSLNEELIIAKSYEEKLIQSDADSKETKDNLKKKVVELEWLLSESMKKIEEVEDSAKSSLLQWERERMGLRHHIDSCFGSLQQFRSECESLKQEVLKTRNSHAEDFLNFGYQLGGLIDISKAYHGVLEENVKLYNEVQDLKGNIRVYCRIKPILLGQSERQTTIQYIDENGELGIVNPLNPGKNGQRLFKFNKVFGPTATQADVYRDIQPLIRSVLDGFNVCIFAYGQTGSGKTYTMTGPNLASSADWGVNYRALNDLFSISKKRRASFTYEIGVQMVEIYNEQVCDLLRCDNLQKRLGIWSISQPNGSAVLDATLHPVKSTSDVIDLMRIGLMNRSVGATALNERSSRSHSIFIVVVHGTDLETRGTLHGCLHLVDLAGSERIDRSQAAGERLREAQHINKSLSALGDVMFALAQKSPHVPYRNSKLTQLLQSSLGGRAKTLMCIQLNPDGESYSEMLGTLKFAERVSGIELGAATSHRGDRGVKELMEQIACLKDVIAKKDEEIAHLRLLKTSSSTERRHMSSPRLRSSSPRRHSLGGLRPSPKHSAVRSSHGKSVTASEYGSEYSDKQSEAGSQQSVDDLQHHRDFFHQSRLAVLSAESYKESSKYLEDDVILLGIGDDDSEERLSDISDSVLSMGTETDGSISSIVEYTLFPETTTNSCDEVTEKSVEPVQVLLPPTKPNQTGSSRFSTNRVSSKTPSLRRAVSGNLTASKPHKRWQ